MKKHTRRKAKPTSARPVDVLPTIRLSDLSEPLAVQLIGIKVPGIGKRYRVMTTQADAGLHYVVEDTKDYSTREGVDTAVWYLRRVLEEQSRQVETLKKTASTITRLLEEQKTCKPHAFQDKRYGPLRRVLNPMVKKLVKQTARCTVCGEIVEL